MGDVLVDGGTVWIVEVVLLVHVARIMRVNRIIRTRMVHFVVSIFVCDFCDSDMGVILSLF